MNKNKILERHLIITFTYLKRNNDLGDVLKGKE